MSPEGFDNNHAETNENLYNIEVVETIRTIQDLNTLAAKYRLMDIPQPTMILSRIAEILYETNPDKKYGIVDSDPKMELVTYKNEDELIKYAKSQDTTGLSTVNPDGSGTMYPDHLLK